MLAWFTIKQKGGGDLQSKLFRLWDKNTMGTVPIKPCIKRVIKPREGERKKALEVKHQDRGSEKSGEFSDPLL